MSAYEFILYGFVATFILLFVSGCSSSRAVRVQQLDKAIVSVSEWGGTPYSGSTQTHEIKFITVHHGGEYFDPDKDFSSYLVNLQNWSRTKKNWIDIPYHYLIDFDGTIYAGRDIRYPGDTNTAYDPTGHALVCVPGNYEIQQPNEKQLRALVDVLTWLCWKYNLSPEVIRGHKDVAEGTVCPGENLYAYLANGHLRRQVEQQLQKLTQG